MEMPKITLAVASDIALDKLVASDANVRRIKAGVSVEHLAEDIGLDPTVVSRARSSIN
jgi:ParB family chromosome partitioning protein